VTGEITVTLWASSDGSDTDFTVKLVDVHPPTPDYPGGFDLNITDGIPERALPRWSGPGRLLDPGKVYPFVLKLSPTANVPKGPPHPCGHLEQQLPRFDVNSQHGEPLITTGAHEWRLTRSITTGRTPHISPCRVTP